MDFIHLHNHTQYSLLDGAGEIKKLIQKAKEEKFSAIAITDHGVMYGVVDFYTEAIKNGIKPILGCEVYTSPRGRKDKVHGIDSHYGHLVLLAENNTGYKNLLTLVSLGFTEGYYYKPRVDMELLKKYSEGIIALSGCLRGCVSDALVHGDYEGAVKKANELCEVFGKDNFFIEIQNHGIKDEIDIIPSLVEIAKKLDIGVVATNDVHYVNKEDAFLQDVLTCISTGKKLEDKDRLKFFGEEFYLKSKSDMEKLFGKIPNAMENTVKIAQRCNVTLSLGQMHLPSAIVDTDLSHGKYLKKLCYEGINLRYGEINEDLKDRLEYELSVIEKMGYTDYFLIVKDFLSYAKSKGIMVGPGRGSAAGSLVAYSLEITDIDPIKYDLIFERFLNPERISMPDIDIDFCYERRSEVIDYVVNKYGRNRVAQIVTFGTMAARAAIRDVGRVMNVDLSLVSKIAGLIPDILHIKIKDAMSSEKELSNLYNSDKKVRALIDTAMALEGFPRNISTHAAGIVIADKPLNEYVPLQLSETTLLTQYPMNNLEQLGMLKMDFLGLRNLTVIRDTIDLVKKYKNIDIDIKNIDYCQKETFDLLCSGDTDGVFQLENQGLRNFMAKFRPSSIDDIIITTSIYRPGPMEQIPQFLENVKNPQGIKYMHPLLEPILKSTYGAIIYQEQVMEIVRSLAGYSFGRADLVRRAMAKKKQDVMEKERNIFINGLYENGSCVVEGAIKRGISKECANDIFDYLIDFANYAFNKSHAACYATLAYQTAYLKRNYPVEFLVALLKSIKGNFHKTNKYIRAFQKWGIKLLPPDINKSFDDYSIEGNNIRFGLSGIKNVGLSLPKDIVHERERNGDFSSFSDFIVRISRYETNKRAIESFINCGVFDSLYPNRKALCYSFERMMDYSSEDAKLAQMGQFSFFESESLKSVTDEMIEKNVGNYTNSEKNQFEKDLTGMYLNSHPLDDYSAIVCAYSQSNLYNIVENADNNMVVKLCGVLNSVARKRTKSGKILVSMTFSDYFSEIELVAFENAYEKYKNQIYDGAVVYIEASPNNRGEGNVSLVLNTLVPMDTMSIPKTKQLYVKIEKSSHTKKVTDITSAYMGESTLCIYDTEKNMVLKSDSDNCVNISNELVKKLIDNFGHENVKIK